MDIVQRKTSEEALEAEQMKNLTSEECSNTHDNPALALNIADNEKKYFMVLFMIGLLNNTGYVIVGTASQDIAKKFNMENFMSLFQLSLIVLSAVVRSINSKFFLRIPHRKRIAFAISFMILGFTIIALSSLTSNKIGFYTSLLGSMICGAMCAFGESIILGYLKVFPSKLVGGWSSGTGCAGPFGSGLVLVFKAIGFDLYIIFFIMVPLQASYWFWFLWYESKKHTFIDFNRSDEYIDTSEPSQISASNDDEKLQLNNNQAEVAGDVKNNKGLSVENVKSVLSKMWFLAVNLGLVYFLEYVIETGWAERAHPKKENDDYPLGFEGFLEKNGFVILCFCYQIGVFISRSSLYLIKVNRIEIFTLFQVANFVLWIYFAIDKGVSMGLQIPCMIFVGLMGGASYVNVNYSLLNHKKIDKTEKELSMNVCSMFNDCGILMSSLFVLVVDNFIITND